MRLENINEIEELMNKGKKYNEIAAILNLVSDDVQITYGDLMEAVVNTIDWMNYKLRHIIDSANKEHEKERSILMKNLSEIQVELQNFYKATAQKFVYGYANIQQIEI